MTDQVLTPDDVWCARCGPGSFTQHACDRLSAKATSGFGDYVGDGDEHRAGVSSPFLPEFRVFERGSHGFLLRDVDTGEVLHACGTFAGRT